MVEPAGRKCLIGVAFCRQEWLLLAAAIGTRGNLHDEVDRRLFGCDIKGVHRPFLCGGKIVRKPVLKRACTIDNGLMTAQRHLPVRRIRRRRQIGFDPGDRRIFDPRPAGIAGKTRNQMPFRVQSRRDR